MSMGVKRNSLPKGGWTRGFIVIRYYSYYFKFAIGFHLSDVSCPVAACRESPPRKTSYEGFTTRALEGIHGAIPGAIQAAYIQGNRSVEISFGL